MGNLPTIPRTSPSHFSPDQRHRPNPPTIGEIRDEATAAMACRAGLMGRMVLATLHTKSAASARRRILNLGMEEHVLEEVLEEVLRGVLAQRLEVRVCEGCSGAGCEICGGIGVAAREVEVELVMEPQALPSYTTLQL